MLFINSPFSFGLIDFTTSGFFTYLFQSLGIVLNNSSKNTEKIIIKETINLVREKLGPVASYKKSIIVENLPKTRSGKILRSTISKILNKEDYKVPATIEDINTLELIKCLNI